ncbi:Zn-dependent alcohol dehydrogenase [Sphingomonas sp.]|uniref:Zn-dependent alcohol dehydrogenase n=1 Tax=Sphingomonas sp. TaxID=28214 RepID=UPI002DD63A0B|nr:Zn-dependent alcohol dehydrogenase [Sphingomonas sp.]
MRAAIFRQAGSPLEIEQVDLASPGPREIRIRPSYAGLCHSDLHFLDGHIAWPLPAVLGHESAGIVEAVGTEVRDFVPGDHVVTCLSVFCGGCANCTTGLPTHCTNEDVKLPPGAARRIFQNGAPVHQFLQLSSFAEQMLIHEHAAVKIDREVPLDIATLLGCGALTGYSAVVNAARVRGGSSVAVIGCGGIGMAAINAATIAGAARIIAIDTRQEQLDLARRLGATDGVLATRDGDVVAQVRDLTLGGVDYAFEALGSPATVQQAFQMTRPGGVATVIGVVPPGQPITLSGIELLQDRTLQGTMMGGSHFRVDIPRMLDLWRQGRLNLDMLKGDVLPLEQINAGFDRLRAGTSGRILIDLAA